MIPKLEVRGSAIPTTLWMVKRWPFLIYPLVYLLVNLSLL